MSKKWLNDVSKDVGHYLAGFVDGEGSFNVSLKKRKDHTMGWQVVPRFSVSQRDRTVLELLESNLGCGTIRQRKRDGLWYYDVLNHQSLKTRVIPFFEKFGFLSRRKEENFSIFSRVVTLMAKGKHLTQEGLLAIVRLRKELNKGKGRKRKYTLDDYKKSLIENPQRLYARAEPRNKGGEA